MDRNPASFAKPPVSPCLVSLGDGAGKMVASSGMAVVPVVQDARLANWSQQFGLRLLHKAGRALQRPHFSASRMRHPASAPQPKDDACSIPCGPYNADHGNGCSLPTHCAAWLCCLAWPDGAFGRAL